MLSHNKLDSHERREAMYLLEQSMGFVWQASLRSVALLGVADHLIDGKKTIEQLASDVKVNEDFLYRIMRILASRGVFNELSEGFFCLSQSAKFLCTEHEFSLRPAVLMLTDKTFWHPAAEIEGILKGNQVFNELFGMPFYEYWEQSPASTGENIFHAGMASMSSVENEVLVDSYEFPENALVVDIAGGLGNLLLCVLRRNPTLTGILFDRGDVLDSNRLHLLNNDERWQTISGSFFEECPSADIYMLKYILMDWPDLKSIQILKNCRRAMKHNSRLLVFEPVIKSDTNEQGRYEIDILLLTSFDGGKARTEKEFSVLLEKADLKINRIIHTDSYLSIIEAIPL